MKTHDSRVKRILVVEDEPAIRTICLRVLTGEGFEVDTAVDAKVAQDLIENKQYDLYLVDIRTPVMNGEELYQWLQEKHPRLVDRVIFASGSIENGETAAFVKQTGRSLLPKPYTNDELRALVRETLKRLENGRRTRKSTGR